MRVCVWHHLSCVLRPAGCVHAMPCSIVCAALRVCVLHARQMHLLLLPAALHCPPGNACRREKQEDLLKQKNEETLRRLTAQAAGGGAGGDNSKGRLVSQVTTTHTGARQAPAARARACAGSTCS